MFTARFCSYTNRGTRIGLRNFYYLTYPVFISVKGTGQSQVLEIKLQIKLQNLDSISPAAITIMLENQSVHDTLVMILLICHQCLLQTLLLTSELSTSITKNPSPDNHLVWSQTNLIVTAHPCWRKLGKRLRKTRKIF